VVAGWLQKFPVYPLFGLTTISQRLIFAIVGENTNNVFTNNVFTCTPADYV